MKFKLPKRRPIAFYIGAALILGTILVIGSFTSQLFLTSISISAEKVSKPITNPFQSRFLPSSFYFPKGESHPKDKEDRPMAIIAQINFEEIPHLKGYPKTGILQFFIAAHDDLLGWDEDNFANPGNNQGYHVRFFPTVDRDLSKQKNDFSFLPPPTDYGEVFLPLEDEARLTFQKRTEFINPDGDRFTRIFGKDFYERLGPFEGQVWNWFYARPSRNQHKIGG